ncbi:hypothetical protein ABZ401_27430 [Streptomyces sp. NPDC005892]|uniref:hypothetical protein n=1 Tax=Streptomyces sp. NPDC005892 TaxID=3155593 RepID=UPI00340E0EDE
MDSVRTHHRFSRSRTGGAVHVFPLVESEASETAGPRVGDDMTVEVALSVMASARVEHLLVCDNDGLRTGMVTMAVLAAVRDGAGYTDRIQLRDILADGRDGAPDLLALVH